MSDTLAIAVSQSGTTTDTNRTVDLLRGRGAAVLGIVNRRSSDLTDKADGVLYTSDGRDVEMSVASTKAFYAQVAAGVAAGLRDHRGRRRRHRPSAAHELLALAARAARRDARPCSPGATSIADAARRFAPSKRYWAVVGNGPNKVAAEEVRIKLSELCYKSIACDVTEDKKHIDLSSEPLILVCAAGLAGSTADDVGKEVAIFRAHKATPIVIADEGDARYPAAADRSPCRRSTRRSAFVLSAMVGHLFGYEAALAIDALGAPAARGARGRSSAPSASESTADAVLAAVRGRDPPPRRRSSSTGCASSRYDGHLEASTAVRLAGLLRDVHVRRAGRGVPGRVGQGRLAGGARRRPRRRPDPGDRGADPARRRHQAPGQDGHRRHLPQRRGRARPAARAGRARRRRRARRAQLPHAQGARRPRPGGRRGHRLHPLRHRRRRRSRSSTAAGSPASCRAASTATRRSSAPSAASPASARCSSPAGRSDGRTVIFVPEVKAERRDRHHAAARALPRPARPGRRCAACCRATTAATTASSTG